MEIINIQNQLQATTHSLWKILMVATFTVISLLYIA